MLPFLPARDILIDYLTKIFIFKLIQHLYVNIQNISICDIHRKQVEPPIMKYWGVPALGRLWRWGTNRYLFLYASVYVREAAKKVFFFSGPATKSLPPSPSSNLLAIIFFLIFFLFLLTFWVKITFLLRLPFANHRKKYINNIYVYAPRIPWVIYFDWIIFSPIFSWHDSRRAQRIFF